MSLDPRDNDGGTWGIAMTTHASLKMVTRQPDGTGGYLDLGLMPLGSVDVIKRFIQNELDHVRRETPGGVLPRVITVPVTGAPTPLVLPASLPRETILTFQAAARLGVDALTDAVSTLQDTSMLRQDEAYEGIYRANNPDASEREVREEMQRHRRDSGREDPGPSPTTRTILSNLLDDNGAPSDDADIDRAAAALDGEGLHDDGSALTAVQNYAALATVLGSVAEVTVNSATAPDAGNAALQTAQRVLTAISSVCDVVAGVSAIASSTIAGAIVAAVFELLGLVCRLINWILSRLAGYTVSPLEGWDSEWSNTDGQFILRERLRILVQIEESLVNPAGWSATWTKAVQALDVDDGALIREWVYQTALNRGLERVGNAKAIAQVLGGRQATASYNMCEDIQNWLLYVGMKPERADIIFTWLYEARKVTEVLKRRDFLARLRGDQPHEGPGYGVEYRGNMATYVGGSNCASGDHACRDLGRVSAGGLGCQVNFEYGSRRWYANCKGLDVANAALFVPFEKPQLEALYSQLATELEVTTVAMPPASGIQRRASGRMAMHTVTPEPLKRVGGDIIFPYYEFQRQRTIFSAGTGSGGGGGGAVVALGVAAAAGAAAFLLLKK